MRYLQPSLTDDPRMLQTFHYLQRMRKCQFLLPRADPELHFLTRLNTNFMESSPHFLGKFFSRSSQKGNLRGQLGQYKYQSLTSSVSLCSSQEKTETTQLQKKTLFKVTMRTALLVILVLVVSCQCCKGKWKLWFKHEGQLCKKCKQLWFHKSK